MSCFHNTPTSRIPPRPAPLGTADASAADASPTADSATGRRRKLWEIKSSLLCSLVGTCLTLGDLRRIERRLKIDQLQSATDFHVHGTFVVWAAQPGPVAKQMHKLLERRYQATIRRFAVCSSAEDVAALWQAGLDDGDVPGPYWALLTHPAATEALMMRAFGEVHMLSHLVGAANRGDHRRMAAIERNRDALTDAVAVAKQRLIDSERDLRQVIDQHVAEVHDLTARLSDADAMAANLRAAEARLAALTTGEAERAVESELAAVEAQLSEVTQELAQQQATLSQLTSEYLRLPQAKQDADALTRALVRERDMMEYLVRTQVAPASADAGEDVAALPAPDRDIDLTGQRIVYVGGRGSTIPHLRAVVERCGGIFLHHDGGLEEQNSRLDRLLDRGDAVFCPIDCISHDACQRAKRSCRQRESAFVPLRTCSMSSFLHGLRLLVHGAQARIGD